MSMIDYPKRIAYIIGKMWAGGVESVVFNYYRAIDHSKYQFDFYYDEDSTVAPPQELIDMGAKFIMLPPYQRLPQYMKALRRYLREGNYTIIHSHLNTLSVFPLYAAWREHIPVRIAHNHSVPGGNEFKRNILKQVLRRFSKIFANEYFACSEKAGRWMFGNKAFDNGDVYVLKNAIDFERFRPDEDEVEKFRKSLALEGKFVVGHIGRFTYAKNHMFLLDIFEEITRLKDHAVLLLVGDGEMHDEIIKEIQNKKIEDKTVLIGKASNPEKYYGLMDVVVLPSIFEGLSMTTIESQISGVPVIISKAIPQEAVISDACLYMDLTDSAVKWAEAAASISNKEIHYFESAKDYDIKNEAPFLEGWYTAKYKELKRQDIVK